jgi:hypothetical protein
MVGGYHRKRNGPGALLCLVVLVFPFHAAAEGAVIMSIQLGLLFYATTALLMC